MFTNKEWQVAKEKKDKYYLVIVQNVNGEAKVKIIQNPSEKISVNKNIFTSVQINWSVSQTEINNLLRL